MQLTAKQKLLLEVVAKIISIPSWFDTNGNRRRNDRTTLRPVSKNQVLRDSLHLTFKLKESDSTFDSKFLLVVCTNY